MTSSYKVLKQAYWILRTHPFLWTFGLFLFWGNLINFFIFSVEPTSRDLVFENHFSSWVANHTALAVFLVLLIVITVLILLGLYVRARAGIILSVKNITVNQPYSFAKGFREGRLYFDRILRFVLYITFSNLLLLSILLAPVIYLISIGYVFRSFILGLLGAAVYLPVYLGSVFLLALVPCFIVLYNMNLRPAILSSLDLIRECWAHFLMFFMILFLISAAVLFVVIALSAAIMVPFVFLANLFYHTGGSQLSLASTSIGLVVAAVVFLIAHATLAAYQQTSWVLYYLELVKPTTSPEAEAEIVPEIA